MDIFSLSELSLGSHRVRQSGDVHSTATWAGNLPAKIAILGRVTLHKG